MGTVSFQDFHLHPNVLSGLNAPSFAAPTPLQAEVIPLIMAGKDVIATADAGLQKTAAFIIPILHRLSKGEQGATRALILTPTAQSAELTHSLAERLGKNSGLKTIALYGKSATTQQQKILRMGTEIIIGTPGAVLDGLWKGLINLSNLETMVIDEADEMANQGLLSDIFNILMCITHKRQTLLFSATMPVTIKKLSRQFLRNPVSAPDPAAVPAQASAKAKPAVKTPVKPEPPKALPPAPAKLKMNTALLRAILAKSKNDGILVFTRTKENARTAAAMIIKAGFQVTFTKGRLPQKNAGTAPRGIPTGPVIILIVTDSASRGLDMAKIFRAINDPKPLKGSGGDGHIGRTGRLDENGKAITLVTRADELILFVLEKYLDAPLEQVEV